jgi:hypothetical protein
VSTALTRWAPRGLVIAGAVTACVAVFHAVAIVVPTLSEPSPAWRHALFVGVNAFFAWGFLTRAKWLPLPFGVLCVQQVWSHGSAFLAARAGGHTDVQSLLVLASLPLLGVLVAYGRKLTPPAPRPAGSCK